MAIEIERPQFNGHRSLGWTNDGNVRSPVEEVFERSARGRESDTKTSLLTHALRPRERRTNFQIEALRLQSLIVP
jgi:hypothetical protein